MNRAFLRQFVAALANTAWLIALAMTAVLIASQTLHGQTAQPQQHEPSVTGPFWGGAPSDPWFWVVIGAWLFSGIVSGMPDPKPEYGPFYEWAYHSLHIIAASKPVTAAASLLAREPENGA